jgi:8-amino-7-oxononanoate synthase
MIDAAKRWGAGAGAAHLVTGHTQEHHALEAELADFTGREAALLFSTGYMANLGVLQAFSGRGETVLQDRLNHASLIDGAQLAGAKLSRFAHADIDDAAHRLATAEAPVSVLATDGVFSMDGTVAPVSELAALAKRHRAWFMVDDAHGFGVLGAQGGGVAEAAALSAEDIPVLVGTLGKAFGSFGAFVAGDRDVIDFLLQRARTGIYTTAMPAAVAAATRAALRVLREEGWRRDQLAARIARFRAGCAANDIPLTASTTPIQPILLGDAALALAASKSLWDAGWWVSAIRPPTVPRGTARLRVTLSTTHTDAQIDGLVEALARALPAAVAA